MVVAATTSVGLLHFTCPPVVGGVESLIRQHSRLLLAHGYQVVVVAGRGGRFDSRVPLRLIPELYSRHPALLAVNEELRHGDVSPRFEQLVDQICAALRAALRDLDICIVHNAFTLHFNLPLTVALARMVDRGEAPRLIAWCHDLAWTNPLYTPIMYDRPPWTLLRTHLSDVAYVVVSEDRRRDLVALWQRGREAPAATPPVVVGAGVDPGAKLRLRRATVELARQLRFDRAHPFMLLPARITRRKNIELAIRVTRALRDLGYAPLLLVTGPPGPHNIRSIDYVDALRAERERLDVVGDVVFLFEQRRSDGRPWAASDAMMDDLYQLADLLVFPSAQEGFGIPLLEAGLARLPVFCSDIAPFREIAGDGAHYFDLDESPAQIAARIARLLESDPAARLRRRVLETYTWDQVFVTRIQPLLADACPPASRTATA